MTSALAESRSAKLPLLIEALLMASLKTISTAVS